MLVLHSHILPGFQLRDWTVPLGSLAHQRNKTDPRPGVDAGSHCQHFEVSTAGLLGQNRSKAPAFVVCASCRPPGTPRPPPCPSACAGPAGPREGHVTPASALPPATHRRGCTSHLAGSRLSWKQHFLLGRRLGGLPSAAWRLQT